MFLKRLLREPLVHFLLLGGVLFAADGMLDFAPEPTLVELKVKRELIDQVMAIAAGARDAVLNRPVPAK